VAIATGKKGLEALKKQKELSKITYPLRFKDIAEWTASPLSMDIKNGPSPGGASAELGVSRQTIYKWVQRGFLECINIGNGHAVLVSSRSLRRVKHELNQLREEWGTTKLQGFQVIKELEKRLPQLDMFEDL
jgi:hypothetical protein